MKKPYLYEEVNLRQNLCFMAFETKVTRTLCSNITDNFLASLYTLTH